MIYKMNNLFMMVLLCLTFNNCDGASTVNKRSLADNIQSGIKFAGQMLGIDTAAEVADLVARAFTQNAQQPLQYQNYQNNFNAPIAMDANTPSTMWNNRADEPQLISSQFGGGGGVPPSFQQPIDNNQVNNGPQGGIISNLLRVIGLDGGKIGALAVNGIIFIAQMIGRSLISSFTSQWPKIQLSPQTNNEFEQLNQQQQPIRPSQYERQERRSVSPGTPLDWLLDNQSSTFSKLLVDVRDKNLPQRVIEMVDTLEEKTGDADCLKLLVCKSAPFVWGMQRAINAKIRVNDDDGVDGNNDDNTTVNDDGTINTDNNSDDDDDDNVDNEINDENNNSNNNGNTNSSSVKDESMIKEFFKFLPDLNEFRKNGELCETKYVNCTVFAK